MLSVRPLLRATTIRGAASIRIITAFAHDVNPTHFHSIGGGLHDLRDNFVSNPVLRWVKVATTPAPRTGPQGPQANVAFVSDGIRQAPGLILDGTESDGIQREERLIDSCGRVRDPF